MRKDQEIQNLERAFARACARADEAAAMGMTEAPRGPDSPGELLTLPTKVPGPARYVADVPGPDDTVAQPSAAAIGQETGEQPPDVIAGDMVRARCRGNERYLKRMGVIVLGAIGASALWAIVAIALTDEPDLSQRGIRSNHHLAVLSFRQWSADRRSAFTMVLLAVTVIAVGSVVRRESGGLRDYFIGKDGRFSTSQLQTGVWTIVLAFSLGYLVLRPAFGASNASFVSSFEHLDITYLVLLGGPFAAAAAVRSIVTTKASDGAIQKVTSPEAQIRDFSSNDNGKPDFVDTQFLLFNAVALIGFVANFAARPDALPSLPVGLAGLTGVSALVYTGNKALTTNPPEITAVSPASGTGPARPGDVLLIHGKNFVPPGASNPEQRLNLAVRFGDYNAPVAPIPAPDDTSGRSWVNPTAEQIRVRVPHGVMVGDTGVRVVTAAHVESKPYILRIEPGPPDGVRG